MSSSAVTSRARTSRATTRSRAGSPRERARRAPGTGRARRRATARPGAAAPTAGSLRCRAGGSRRGGRRSGRRRPDAAGGPVALDGEHPPSRRRHVSASAWDSSGRAPGSPSVSRTSRSTSPGSRRSPACAAGPSMAARRASPVSGPTRCRPCSARRANAGVGAEAGEVVGPHRDHDRRPSRGVARPDRRRRRRRSSGVVAEGEQLLELVDDERPRCRLAAANALVSAASGSAPGTNSDDSLPRRCSAGTSPARTSDDLPHPDGPATTSSGLAAQPLQAGGDLGVAAEEAVDVADVVGRQALVRALLAIAGGSALPGQRRGPGAGSPPPAPPARGPGRCPSCSTSVRRARLQRPQRVGLAAAAVLGQGQDRPAPLPQRLLARPGPRPRPRPPDARRRRAGRRAGPPRRCGAAPPGGRPRCGPAPSRRGPRTVRPATATRRPRERRRRPLGLSGRRQLAAPLDQRLEALGIEVVAVTARR